MLGGWTAWNTAVREIGVAVESRRVVGVFRDRSQAKLAVAEALRQAMDVQAPHALVEDADGVHVILQATGQLEDARRLLLEYGAYCAFGARPRSGLNAEPPFGAGRPLASRDRRVPDRHSGFRGSRRLLYARVGQAMRTIEVTSVAPRAWACCSASSADAAWSVCSAR
jgi:hypothetical protein